MLLKPSEKTFSVPIDGVGNLILQYPTLAHDLKIDATQVRLLSGNPNPTVHSQNISYMMAFLAVLTVETPKNWNIDELYRPEDLKIVYDQAFEKVSQFRGQDRAKDKDPGAQAGPGAQVLVPAEVQPGA